MTRKHFERVAAIFKERFDYLSAYPNAEAYDLLSETMAEMADMFIEDNPRFDRQRFYRACGV